MGILWWLSPVCGAVGVAVVVGFLHLLASWVDWCERRRLPDFVCMAGAFAAVSGLVFGLGYAIACLLLASAG